MTISWREQQKRLDEAFARLQQPPLKPDQPCGHLGCLSHATHPCEGCGRVSGRYPERMEF